MQPKRMGADISLPLAIMATVVMLFSIAVTSIFVDRFDANSRERERILIDGAVHDYIEEVAAMVLPQVSGTRDPQT